MTDDGLATLSLRAQAAAVRAGEVWPERLARAASERIAAVDDRIHAICAVAGEGDEAQELRAVQAGPLYGVPVGVKDMFGLAWRAPTDGAPVAPAVPGRVVSGVARRLREAGALATVVTNMHQLGIGTTGHVSAYGPTVNPWSADRCAGGSSGGSAAAVALGMVAGAVGTDAGGSIRIPASYCGVVGLKPTWGAVPVDGYTGAYSTMGAIGPIARDAADCRLLAEALAGRPTPRCGNPSRPLRVGVLTASHGQDVDPAVLARVGEALDVLAQDGHRRVDVDLPAAEHLAIASVLITGTERLPQLNRAWLRDVFPSLDPSVRAILRSRMSTTANAVTRAARYRAYLRRAVARLLDEVDVLAMPTVPSSPPEVRRPRAVLPSGAKPADVANLHHAGLANLTGVPAISIPCGVDGAGLPVGLCLHARWGDEATLLDIAERYETLTERCHVIRVDDLPVPTATGGAT